MELFLTVNRRTLLTNSFFISRIRFDSVFLSLLIHVLIGTYAGITQAQSLPHLDSNSKSSISLQWGVHLLSKQDLLLSPLIEQDASLSNIGLSYQHTKRKSINRLSIEFDKYQPQSHKAYPYLMDGGRQYTIPSTSTIVNVRYGHLRRIAESPFLAGMMLDNQIRAGEQAYGWSTTFHYLGTFSLSPTISYEHTFAEKWQLRVQTWLPLMSWVTRSPYALNDDQYMKDNANHNGLKTFFNYVANGKIQSLNHFKKINLHTSIAYSIGRKTNLLLSYQFEALGYAKPRSLISFQHSFNTGIQFTFN